MCLLRRQWPTRSERFSRSPIVPGPPTASMTSGISHLHVSIVLGVDSLRPADYTTGLAKP
jgi:hypothetical protein